jgi:hypothetical protein
MPQVRQAELRGGSATASFEMRFAISALDTSLGRHSSAQKNPLPPTGENLAEGESSALAILPDVGAPSNADSSVAPSFYLPAPSFFKDPPDVGANQNSHDIAHRIHRFDTDAGLEAGINRRASLANRDLPQQY